MKMSMGVETEQMRVFITRGFAALQSAVAVALPAPPAAADPRGVDRPGAAEEVYVGTPVRPTGFDTSRPH